MSSVGPQESLILPPSSGDQFSLPGAPPLPAPSVAAQTVSSAAPQVPALEPPAPISKRFGSRVSRLQWWLDRGQELPSWMTSVVLHLAIIILFASLAVKASPRPNALLVLALSATTADQVDDNSNAIEIMPFESLTESQEASNTTFVVFENHATAPIEALTVVADLLEARDTEPANDAVESLAGSKESTTDWVGSLPVVDEVPVSGTPISVSTPPASNRDTKPEPPAAPDYDDIVARFIQYDIGNLPGAAGNRALREFNQLGTVAIPALVRGLNQSARIQASCPVGVISRKLEQTVQQANDQATLDYVVQNLGRDVPRNAPHANRVESLRRQLAVKATRFEVQQFNRDFTGVRPIGSESRSQFVARVKLLYDAGAERLATALQDERIEEQSAAWAALSMRQRPELTPAERTQLAGILLAQWPYREPYCKRIHDALTTLAQGSGVAEELPDFSRQQTATQRQWESWWSEYGSTNPEVASAELLRLAEAGSGLNAQRLLAQTVQQYPGTRNAELARHMLTPNSKLLLAQGLERQSRWADAISLYKEIATDFPRTGYALAARQRLSVIGRFREPDRASSE